MPQENSFSESEPPSDNFFSRHPYWAMHTLGPGNPVGDYYGFPEVQQMILDEAEGTEPTICDDQAEDEATPRASRGVPGMRSIVTVTVGEEFYDQEDEHLRAV